MAKVMKSEIVETAVKGRWVRVRALPINGVNVVLKGKWLKLAVIHEEQWSSNAPVDPESCVRALKDYRAHGLRGDIFTFAQKVSETCPIYKYPVEWDSVAAVHITSFNDWWESLPQETRKNVRRSKKRGVEVILKVLDDDLINGIIEVNDDAPFRQRIPNVHFGKSFEQVRKDQSSFLDRSDYICAFLGEELVGFIKLVYGDKTASILQIQTKPRHHDKRASNALLAKAVEVCEARGVSHLIYGMFNYGKKRDNTLREFKIRNGFTEILVPRFYVPLSLWGTFCLKLGLHRGIIGILPHNVIKLWVRARAKWYSVTSLISRRSSIAEQSNSTRQTECSNPSAGSTP